MAKLEDKIRWERFQPTLPVRGVTLALQEMYERDIFQPTLPVRGVTLRY